MQKTTRELLVLLVLSIAAAKATATPGHNDTLGDQSEHYNNITGGNRLWSGLLRDCKVPTISCVQKNVYHYLDDTFAFRGDITFGNLMHFKRNSIDYSKLIDNTNDIEDDDDFEDNRSMSPLEEVTRALQNKSVGFLMTHDMEMQLPDMLFEGSTLKVSPRSFEGDGVIVKLDLVPKEVQDNKEVGRIFFKKIKKFFKNKLAMAFMSIVLVIGLIKTKLMFLMPVIVGVGTAKKVLLKVLLFLFPALSHLFKLCSYYHDTYHSTKYHHHHHQIAHIHHVPSPPLHPHIPDIHVPHEGPYYKHEHDGLEFSGPGLGPEYISNRNAYGEHTPSSSDENEIQSWGLGHAQGHKGGRRGHQPPPPKIASPLTMNQIDELTMQAEREILLKTRLQQEQQRIRQENLRLQEQLKQELKLQEQLQLQAMILAQQKTKLHPQVQMHPGPVQPHVQFVQSNVMAQAKSHVVPATYDAFYSPILERIDKVFNTIGIGEEQCRERLVCSMYKNPSKFSPHSNLISAELSRDSKDLQKPTASNEAVVRFYRYVQAARDGQDQRECLRLYPSCNINTEL